MMEHFKLSSSWCFGPQVLGNMVDGEDSPLWQAKQPIMITVKIIPSSYHFCEGKPNIFPVLLHILLF